MQLPCFSWRPSIAALLLSSWAAGALPAQGPGVDTASAGHAFTYNARRDYPVTGAVSTAVADFNGDGLMDTASVSQDDYDIHVWLGAGHGTLKPGPTTQIAGYNAVHSMWSISAGDFNGDGKPDVAVADIQRGLVIICLGNGDGTFTRGQAYEVGALVFFNIGVGDFNGDGKLDFATTGGGNVVLVALGNGDGTFQPLKVFPIAGLGFYVTVADLNHDGKLDIVATGPSLSVLLGNGDGTFQPYKSYPVQNGSISVAVGDFNHDGKPDLVSADGSYSYVRVLFGNGDGTFRPYISVPVPGVPSWVAAGDVNGDGVADIVANGVDEIVLLSKGNGTFQTPVTYTVGQNPVEVRLADVSGAGRLDVVTSNFNGASVSVLLNQGKGKFQDGTLLTLPGTPGALQDAVKGDWNGDGKPDLAVAALQGTQGTIQILLGTGKAAPAFTLGQTITLPEDSGENQPFTIATADVNHDGKLDLVVGMIKAVAVLLGNGDGTFQPPIISQAPLYASGGVGYIQNLALADFNGDGNLDIATDGSLILFGDGDGTFTAATSLYTPEALAWIVAGDYNHDGKADLVVGYYYNTTNPYLHQLQVFLGNGDGTFTVGQQIPNYSGYAFSQGELDGDRNPDLVVGPEIYLGNPDGTFTLKSNVATGVLRLLGFGFPAFADINGDGKIDLAFPLTNGALAILLGNGDGTFTFDGFFFGTLPYVDRAIAGHFHPGATPDIIVCGGNSSLVATLQIMLGTTPP